jgi:isoleucyl-tRNA synthetase
MYSVNQPGESKNFDERSVDEINKRIFNLLDNVYSFYELYKDDRRHTTDDLQPKNVLDQWILSRLNELTKKVTENLDSYRLLEPVRSIREFIDDLSTWYLRRSRDRIKEGDVEAKQTLHLVLKNLAKLLAPFAPFAAEDLYQKLRSSNDPESVHLESWPKAGKADAEVLENMKRTREVVSQALEARSKAGIKIRQPLGKLEVRSLKLGEAYLKLIQDEINVKEVVVNENLETEVKLDTTITPELEEEGKMREVVRSIQDLRKEKNLKPSDKMPYEIPEEQKEIFAKFREEIKKATNIEF